MGMNYRRRARPDHPLHSQEVAEPNRRRNAEDVDRDAGCFKLRSKLAGVVQADHLGRELAAIVLTNEVEDRSLATSAALQRVDHVQDANHGAIRSVSDLSSGGYFSRTPTYLVQSISASVPTNPRLRTTTGSRLIASQK